MIQVLHQSVMKSATSTDVGEEVLPLEVSLPCYTSTPFTVLQWSWWLSVIIMLLTHIRVCQGLKMLSGMDIYSRGQYRQKPVCPRHETMTSHNQSLHYFHSYSWQSWSKFLLRWAHTCWSTCFSSGAAAAIKRRFESSTTELHCPCYSCSC
jgi:hypothetical protein